MSNDYLGQTVLITGAGRGIGAAAAKALAAKACNVVVWDRHQDMADATVAEIKMAGGNALAVYGSVANSGDAGRAVETTVAVFGSIHILLNSAGFGIEAPIWEVTDEQWAYVSSSRSLLLKHLNVSAKRLKVERVS